MRIEMMSRVGSDGVLVLTTPMRADQANREVKAVVESMESPVHQKNGGSS